MRAHLRPAVTGTASRARLVVALLMAALVAACAPTFRGAGPAVAPPRLLADAVVVADGTRLPLHIWLPAGEPRAVVLALHGFNDYGNAFDAPARAFAAAGIATYAYDQRGFGAGPDPGVWPGSETLAADAVAALGLLERAYPARPLYLLGESMGGAVAAVALAGPDVPPIAGVVFVAPAVWGWSSMNLVYRAGLWLGAHLTPASRVSGGGLDIHPSDNIAMLRALSADPLVLKQTRVDAVYGLVDLMEAASRAGAAIRVPALVLYGANDDIVPAEPVRHFTDSLPVAKTMAVYERGYHMLLRDLQARVVHDDVLAWIEDRDRPLPSGEGGATVLAAGAAPPPAAVTVEP